jgi:hypothetical protein
MITLATLLLKLLGMAAGLFFVYLSVFLYEDKEKRIQNALEALWVKVDDLQKHSLSRHTAFMNVVAGLMTKIFDRVFGEKLVSLRSVAVSFCYAVAAFGLTFFLFSWAYENDTAAMYDFFMAFLYGAVFGTIPALFRKKKWVKVWLVFLFLYAVYDIIAPFLFVSWFIFSYLNDAGLAALPWIVLGGLVLSFGLFVACVAITRYLVRRVAASKTFFKTALFTFLNCAPVFLLIFSWVLFLFHLYHAGPVASRGSGGGIPMDWSTATTMTLFFGVMCAIMTNMIFICSTALFALLAATMLVHRITWPLLARPVYALQRLGIAHRKKLYGTLGAGLFFISIGKFEFLEKLIERLNPFG